MNRSWQARCLASALAMAGCSWTLAKGSVCPPPETIFNGIPVAGNCIYEVAVHPYWGAYTAGTGVEHPVTLEHFDDVQGGRETLPMGGGRYLQTGEHDFSIRSWSSGTDYFFDRAHSRLLLEDNGFRCVPAQELEPPIRRDIVRSDGQVVGFSSRFEVDEGPDHMGVVILVAARGEGFEDSAVEVTTTVENKGTEDLRLGFRHMWNLEVLGESLVPLGPVPPEPPVEPWVTREGEWVEPQFDRLFASVTDTPSTEEPYYFGGFSVNGPWSLDPPPTPPDRIVRSADVDGVPPQEKAGPLNVCFLWEPPDPPRGGAGIAGSEAVAYYWGDTEETAIRLAPGESKSVTVWFWAFIENPVTCDAGGPYPPVECTGPLTEAALDGSRSHTVDGNPLLFRWSSRTAGVSFDDAQSESPAAVLPGPESYPIALDVGIGPYTRACETQVEVVDTTPPELSVPPDRVLRTSEYGPNACEIHLELEASAEDRCSPDVTITHTTDPFLGAGGAVAAYDFPPGTTRVLFTAEDPSGNAVTKVTEVRVVDDTPPVFDVLEASPGVLWPPDHKMREVSVRAEARDNCDPAPAITLLGAGSSEPADDRGDGHTLPDFEGLKSGTADFDLRLRAERDGRGAGRVYTVRYEARDEWGNRTVGEAEVRVPHDQGAERR